LPVIDWSTTSVRSCQQSVFRPFSFTRMNEFSQCACFSFALAIRTPIVNRFLIHSDGLCCDDIEKRK
jgi:hypothetical protein